MGFEPVTATIRVSSGSLYDYVILGEHPRATDGYDNAYDTVSPGNLNADMGQPYLSVVSVHPEWKIHKELRGDIRLPAAMQTWTLAVTGSLKKGSALTLSRQREEHLPAGMKLTAREGKRQHDIGQGDYTTTAPGPGMTKTIIITVQQP